jgi:formylglycine-generating enzyme required for sulfatase activity
MYSVALAACLALAASSCEQPPGGASGESDDTPLWELPPAATDGTYTPLAGAEPAPLPGFSWVRGGTVGGSNDYKIEFIYPEGGSFAGETGIQYGAFVSGRVVDIPSFFLAQYEATGSRWREVYDWAVTGDGAGLGYRFAHAGVGDGEEPVAGVSWRDAVVWCNAASEKDGLEPVYHTASGAVLRDATGGEPPNARADLAEMRREKNGYRLPTMCEREYAARGGDPREPDWLYRYAGSDTPDEVAWYYGTSGAGLLAEHKAHPDYGLHPAGQKKPNRLGLYDMSGNVMEWGWDWMNYAANAKLPPMGALELHTRLDPATPEEGPPYGPQANQKPMSGGNWSAAFPYSLVAIWWGYETTYQDDKVGFRLARSAP